MADNTSLLIIGNGFDLQCGLKSSYADFFEWLKKNKKDDSIWEVYFLNNRINKQGWIDIEDGIFQVLSDKELMEKWKREAKEMWTTSSLDWGNKSPESQYLLRYTDFGNYELTSQWFLDELKTFEGYFSEYLKAEVLGNENYLKNAEKLLGMILDDVNTDEVNTKIISFNYTNPFDAQEITNVHGTLDKGDIIFGIDATEELPPDAHIFTKTHRKMLQKSYSRALPWHVTNIKFYGHSLGKADYSYFQSIFDNYNLYGGDLAFGQSHKEQVILQFYFTVYDERKRETITRNLTDSVYRLITAYGQTIDNKDKGKNLLHKLLLEGRVQILELENIK